MKALAPRARGEWVPIRTLMVACSKALRMPDFRDYAINVEKPGQAAAENTRPLGGFLRDIMRENMTNFRVFGPDENI